jgi:transposase
MAINYETRKQVVQAVLAGKSHQEALEEAQITACERSIYRWLEWYREEGEEGLRERRHGVVWKVTDEIRAWLIECCQETPSLSARQLQEQLQETFGMQVSISHINQIRIDEGVPKPESPKKEK